VTKKKLNAQIKELRKLCMAAHWQIELIRRWVEAMDRSLTDRKTRLSKKPK
jgi:hypothetical protein